MFLGLSVVIYVFDCEGAGTPNALSCRCIFKSELPHPSIGIMRDAVDRRRIKHPFWKRRVRTWQALHSHRLQSHKWQRIRSNDFYLWPDWRSGSQYGTGRCGSITLGWTKILHTHHIESARVSFSRNSQIVRASGTRPCNPNPRNRMNDSDH
jgi:hypothetical protein